MKRSLVFSVILMSFVSILALAGDGHNHESSVEPAPHGGILRDAAPYKTELVLKGDLAKIYVYQKDLKPAKVSSQELRGEVRFPKQKKSKAVIFKATGESFDATIEGISKVHRYDLHIKMIEGGTETLFDFGVDNIH